MANIINSFRDPSLASYYEGIAAIRDSLLQLGEWTPNKPYSANKDSDLVEYFDNIDQHRLEIDKAKTTTQTTAEINQYYTIDVANKRYEDVSKADTPLQGLAKSAETIAKNSALTLLFQQTHKVVKKADDKKIEKYYGYEEGKMPKQSPSPTFSKPSEALLSAKINEGSELSVFEEKRKKTGVTGDEVAKLNEGDFNEFDFKSEQKQINVPNQKFIEANPNKLGKFKDTTGVSNIEELYKKNEEDRKKTSSFFTRNNTNTFTGSKEAIFNQGFPTSGEPVGGHDLIGDIITGDLTYGIGSTDTQPAQKQFKSWAKKNPVTGAGIASTPASPMTAKIDEMLTNANNQLTGSYKFFIEKLHGRGAADGVPYKKNPVVTRSGEFRPSDLINRMVFPAYISAFNDSYDASHDSYDFIGRGESVYVWNKTTRTLTLEFYMMSDISAQLLQIGASFVDDVSQSKQGQTNGRDSDSSLNATIDLRKTVQDIGAFNNGKLFDASGNVIDNIEISDKEKFEAMLDLFPDWGLGVYPYPRHSLKGRKGFVAGEISGTPDMLWERVTFLTQCVYGWYRKDGKLKEQPIVRIRIADFFDVTAIITSLNFTQDEFDVDLNPSNTVGNIPTGVKVSIQATVLHEDEPTSEYRRFYHRADYDTEKTNVAEDEKEVINPSKTLDSTTDTVTSGSPLFALDKSNVKQKASAFPNQAATFLAGVKTLDKSLKDLQTSGLSMKDVAKRDKIKKVLQNTQQLAKLKQTIQTFSLKEEIPKGEGLANKKIEQVTNIFKKKKA